MNVTLKAKVRHWFNFYRLALESSDPVIAANIARSSDFYNDWGDVRSVSFEDWWKTHSRLFNERQSIQVLEGAFDTDGTHLFLKVPMNASPIAISKAFARIYREEQVKRAPHQSKVKKKYVGQYQLSPLEFQATNFRYYTIFAERVYMPLLKESGRMPKTKAMVELATVKFKNLAEKTSIRSRTGDKQRVAPFRQNINESYEALSRTATRYRVIVENLIRNASLGVFPGEYQEVGLKNLHAKRSQVKDANAEPMKRGRKRKPRQIGYQKATTLIDQNSPTTRTMLKKSGGF